MGVFWHHFWFPVLTSSGCSTVQSYSDTNSEWLASNFTGLRAQSHKVPSFQTLVTSPRSPGYLCIYPILWQILVFPRPPPSGLIIWMAPRTQENTLPNIYWFSIKDITKEQPNGRDAQGAFIPSAHASLSQHRNVLTNLDAPESHCSRVFIYKESSAPEVKGGANSSTCIS